jgi:polysaccharide chain length determinant protein (PEP-CTERM system associated)
MTQRPDSDIDGAPAISTDVVLDVWRRRKWLAIAVFVVVLAGAITAVASLPNLYKASATVLIERPRISEAFVRTSVTAELETRIQTIHRQVMSRQRLTDVINRLGLYPELRGVVPIDALVDQLRQEAQLRLQGVEQSTGRTETIAFTLSYSGRNPDVVARVANTLAGFYIEGNTQSREQQATETAEFLEARLNDAKRELEQQAQRERQTKQRQTTELHQIEVSLTALERLNTQLRLNNEAQMRAMERRERLEMQVADADSVPVAAPAPETPAAQLIKLREQLSQLRRQYSDQYPEVIRLRAEIAALEADAPDSGPSGAGSAPPAVTPARLAARQALANADNELRSLKAEETSLRTMIAAHEARVDSAPARSQPLEESSREYDAVNERYQALMKRFEEARLAENLERGRNTEQFRILDPAIPPLHPAAPSRFWLLIMGVIAAVACGFGAIVAAEKLDTTFHTADDLQASTGLPTLARVRLIPTPHRARRERVRFVLMTAAAIAVAAVVAAGTYYVAGGNEQIVRMTARPAL